MEEGLNAFRDALNAYISWSDTPGAILTLFLLPVGVLLGVIGKWLDQRASYWRRT